jgi:Fungal specific transcription factor domain
LEEAVVSLMQHEDEIQTIWNHETIGEKLHGLWKDSALLHELEGLLSKLEATESAGKRKREREDSESDGAPDTTFQRTLAFTVLPVATSVGPMRQVSQNGLLGGIQNSLAARAHANTIRSSLGDDLNGDFVSSHDALRFPARTPALLDLYFSHTHPWFPILERHHILRISYSCSSNHQRPESMSSADLATLWALVAYVDKQYFHLSTESRPSSEMRPEEMSMVAMSLMPALDSGAFEIGHVQALLLVALNSIGSQWSQAWMVIGHAVRVAMNINVGQISSRGKHALFGCFVLDTWISARLGRRPHMRPADIEHFGHIEEDGLEEWDPWTNSIGAASAHGNVRGPAFVISCFNRMCDIFTVLNDVICDTSSGPERQKFCQQERERIESLFKSLPFVNDSTNNSLTQQHKSPHQTYLALSYLTTKLALDFHARDAEPIPLDNFARNACDMLVLLTQHCQSIGLTVIPPLFEYTMHLSLDGATLALLHFIENTGFPTYACWVHKMSEHVTEMKSLWPIFNQLSDKLAGLERQGRASLTSPITPFPRPTLRTNVNSNLTMQSQQVRHNTQSSFGMTATNITPAFTNDNASASNLNFWEAPTPQVIGSSTLASSIRDQLPESFDMMLTDLTTPTPSSLTMPAGLAMPATSQTSPSFSGDDVDAIFHDLAHLDTTEWTSNREQGLQEFGFADDLTFQAFCNDPDRLVDRATPLEASTIDNAATNFWPPPGFFPDHFGETDPHVEASQILQSLSGNEQYPTLPEGVGW